jgi:colanic acid/amylovoran biosynthesis glycosyltransferase
MSRPLRIGMFVGTFPVASETFVLRQITGLLELGHDVRIFANARGDDGVIHGRIAQHRLLERTTYVNGPPESVLWEMPVTPLRERTWLPGSEQSCSNARRLLRALPKLACCALTAPGLTRSVLSEKEYSYRARSLSGIYRLQTLLQAAGSFDVLHAHFGPVGNCFRFARRLFAAPFVVSFHGYDFSTIPRKEGREVYKNLFASTDVITGNSRFTQTHLEALGCPIGKIVQLPVGLDPGEFAFRERRLGEREPVGIVTVARLVEIKGHEYVLRALAQLRGLGLNFRYHVIGDGPLRKKLETLRAELHLVDCVLFHGALREQDVRQALADAHIFVLSSVNVEGDQEGQGLVLQEAQACGLPVIATRHGAFPEGIAPENTNWLVPERDVAALADKLSELIARKDEWPLIGSAGRKFVESRYDIHRLNQQLVEIYEKAIQAFPG